MNKYDDIINLPHHVSDLHPKMSLYNRSAQFAPFAALCGYGEFISEAGRLTDKKIEIYDELENEINYKLLEIKKDIKSRPLITITYFVKDKYKTGGSYKSVTGNIKKIDEYENKILLTNDIKISINEIIDISKCN